jgi:hypothetical protein
VAPDVGEECVVFGDFESGRRRRGGSEGIDVLDFLG